MIASIKLGTKHVGYRCEPRSGRRPVSRWLEKAMATHSSSLAWKIPWTEEPGRLQSMGSWRVGHDWVTSLSLFTFMHWRRKWHSSVLAWRIPGMGEPGGLPSVGLHRVRHDWSDLAAAAAVVRMGWLSFNQFWREEYWALYYSSDYCSASEKIKQFLQKQFSLWFYFSI